MIMGFFFEKGLETPETKVLEGFRKIMPEKNLNLADIETGLDTTFKTNAEIKEYILKDSGWSKKVVDYIDSKEEYEIYKKAELKPIEINGKDCLIRNDIDWGQQDIFGRTNKERLENGLAPLDKQENPIQLHHIGQHKESPLAELTFEEHRCGGNDLILHDKTKATEVHGEGSTWDAERIGHWKSRYLTVA